MRRGAEAALVLVFFAMVCVAGWSTREPPAQPELTWGATTEVTGTPGPRSAASELRVDDTPTSVEWATSAPWAWEPEWTIGGNDARTSQGRYPIWLGRDRLAGEIGRVGSQIVVWDRHGKVAARLDAACGECGR